MFSRFFTPSPRLESLLARHNVTAPKTAYTMACDKGHIRHCVPFAFQFRSEGTPLVRFAKIIKEVSGRLRLFKDEEAATADLKI